MLFFFVLLDLLFTASNLILDLGLSVQNQVNLEGFVWSHQSITGLISQRQFVPKCQFLASRPLGCCSFQNILTNPTISQTNTSLLPYFISYYSSAFTINQLLNHQAEAYAPQRLVYYWAGVLPLLPQNEMQLLSKFLLFEAGLFICLFFLQPNFPTPGCTFRCQLYQGWTQVKGTKKVIFISLQLLQRMSLTPINCTCKNRLVCSLLPFTLIPQYLKRFS